MSAYMGVNVCAYEAAVTARIRFGQIKFRERGELLFEKKFSIAPKLNLCKASDFCMGIKYST